MQKGIAVNVAVYYTALPERAVRLDIKRLDELHPQVNGNKWFKLKYNIEKVLQSEHRTLLTFGGAWSNHIYATAAAGCEFGFKTIGIIRGEEPENYSPTLQFAQACGMQLEFISREVYREKHTEDFIGLLHDRFGKFHLVPEGGSNFLGVNGCMEILSDSDKNDFDIVACSCGTGATAAGVLLSMNATQTLLVFPALRAEKFIHKEISGHIRSVLNNDEATHELMKRLSFNHRYHFGGYAKWSDELLLFINQFNRQHSIPLDKIYTGKMMYGLMDMISKGEFERGVHILALHTGGLQGNASMPHPG